MAQRYIDGFLTAALVLAALAAGCGDDDGVTDTGMPPGDGGGDAAPDAGDSAVMDGGADAAMDGATDGGAPPACTEDALNHLLVVTTAADFSRAGRGAVDLVDLTAVAAEADLTDSDSVAARTGCTGFVLSRGDGVVSVVDAADSLAFAGAFDVDPVGSSGPYASNPQTIVAASPTKAYVIIQARNAVVVVDPTMTGSDAVLGEIDLSPYLDPDDADGLVDATDAIVVGDRLYVGLGNYWFDSSFAIQFEGSVLAVVDTTTDSLVDADPAADGVQGIDLAGDNPWRGIHHDATTNSLWVATSGDSFALDGQIEAVDLETMTAMGTVLTETDLSGEINGFAVIAPNRVVVVAGTDLVIVDPTVDFIVPEVIGFDMDGVLLHRGMIWAWARGGEQPGLASFDGVTGEETTPMSGRFNFGDLLVFGVVPVP